MDAHQTMNGWLKKINPSDAAMVLNQYGQCELVSNDLESCILLVPNPASTEFHLFQDIAHLPVQRSAEVYEKILAMNLPREAARGGSLAFDALTRNLVFSYSRDIAVTDLNAFCTILENFLDAAREIKKLLATLLQIGQGNPRSGKPAALSGLHKGRPRLARTNKHGG